jgi:hypothetical protein
MQIQEYGQETAKRVSMKIAVSVKIKWKSWTHLDSHSLRDFGGPGPLSGLHNSDLGFVEPIPFALHVAVITSAIKLIDF